MSEISNKLTDISTEVLVAARETAQVEREAALVPSLQQQIAELQQQIEDMTPVEPPPVEPEPEPEPPPVEPEPPIEPEPPPIIDPPINQPLPWPNPNPDPDPVTGRPADIGKVIFEPAVCFEKYNSGGRYIRAETALILRADAGPVELAYNTIGEGGKQPLFTGKTFTLLIDGEPVAKNTPDPTLYESVFQVDLSNVPEGWHVFDIECEGYFSYFLPGYVLHGPEVTIQQDWMPEVTGTFEHKQTIGYAHWIRWVPASDHRMPLPLLPREFPFFDNVPADNDLLHEQLVVNRRADPHRTNITRQKLEITDGNHDYKWWLTRQKYPTNALYEGQRGEACIGQAMHVEIGTATCAPVGQEPVRIDNIKVLTPTGIWKVRKTGATTCLAGYRHKRPQPYWKEIDQDGPPHERLELVGDWSAINEEDHGFRGAWGFTLDAYSTRNDHSHEPIPAEKNMIPHFPNDGVTYFVADTMNGKVRKVRFNEYSHLAEPVITNFLNTDSEVWDAVSSKKSSDEIGTIIISQREEHKITEWKIRDDNGVPLDEAEYVRTIASGADLAYVSPAKLVGRKASLEQIQNEDVVAPEGLYVVDDWLYFASCAMNQVRRINLVTGEMQVCIQEYYSNAVKNNFFMKIAVSDGTAFPKHSIFTSSWSVGSGGAPTLHLPIVQADGSMVWERGPQLARGGSAALSRGRGRDQDALNYSTCAAVGQGRVVYGTVSSGIQQISLADASDPIMTDRAKYIRGREEWKKKGYHMTIGENGLSLHGEPIPWDKLSEDARYFLEWQWHGCDLQPAIDEGFLPHLTET